jgi:hypothetical protein
MSDYVRETRRNRKTGSIIALLDAAHPDSMFRSDEGGRWVTFCETHGLFVQHDTFKLARDWMAEPTCWCQECRN